MEKLNKLIEQRNLLELEAENITIELKSPGPNGELPAGIKDSLIDSEGYPRNDIDLYNVRKKRNRLAIINTDYKNIMKEIDIELKKIYSNNDNNNNNNNENIEEKNNNNLNDSNDNNNNDNNNNQSNIISLHSNTLTSTKSILIPFAIIDEVLPNSPAQLDGLIDGDKLLKFDYIEGTMENPLSLIPRVVLDNANHSINLLVNRNGEDIHIFLTPRSWTGRGLLGCHLTPIV